MGKKSIIGVLELFSEWLTALMVGLNDNKVDDKIKTELMERCGHACALHHGSIETVKTIQRKAKDIDEFLDKLNQQKDFWCGKWMRDGDMIYSICESCGCPLIKVGLIELSPTFCLCSKGWVKVVFEAVLKSPVKVELEQAIVRGDPVCKYIVMPDRSSQG